MYVFPSYLNQHFILFFSFLDGNHKLIKWKFVIHGGIDGYSRMIVYLKCNNDNRATTVLKCFVQATTNYFIPSRVRSDYGGENIEVAKFMLINRGLDRGSILTGSSVHNQRIERLWRDVFQRVTGAFYKLFNMMEEVEILDSLNQYHLYCLHYIFRPRIQNALDIYMAAWNHHPISGENNSSPMHLFVIGTHNLLKRGKVAEDFFHQTDETYGVDEYLGSSAGSTSNIVEVDPPTVSITDEIQQKLSKIKPLSDSTLMGVDLYIAALACFYSD